MVGTTMVRTAPTNGWPRYTVATGGAGQPYQLDGQLYQGNTDQIWQLYQGNQYPIWATVLGQPDSSMLGNCTKIHFQVDRNTRATSPICNTDQFLRFGQQDLGFLSHCTRATCPISNTDQIPSILFNLGNCTKATRSFQVGHNTRATKSCYYCFLFKMKIEDLMKLVSQMSYISLCVKWTANLMLQ